MTSNLVAPPIPKHEDRVASVRIFFTAYRYYFFALMIVLATLAAYNNVLFNFFNAEDFLLMHWLRASAGNYQLLAQQFSGTWLGILDVKYYRPLMMALMSVEYSLWGANGFCFRLVNLLCELSTCLFLGLIACEICPYTRETSQQPGQKLEHNKTDPRGRAHAMRPYDGPGSESSVSSDEPARMARPYQSYGSSDEPARMARPYQSYGSSDEPAHAAPPHGNFGAESPIFSDEPARMARPYQRLAPCDGQAGPVRLAWGYLAAALFALYPLHSESVNWIIGQTDLLALLFFSATLWCHIRWRLTSARYFFRFSMAAAALSFLSKETAIILPIAILGYELLLFDSQGASTSPIHKLKQALIATMPYWLIAVVYLCIRRAALGSFVGGWDNSISFYPSSQSLAHEWFHAFRMMFIPNNASMWAGHSLVIIVWSILLVAPIVGSLYAFTRSGSAIKVALFLLGWFILSLAPSYRFFMIDANLLNSRLAYFATAPLCLFLTYGLAQFSYKPKWSLMSRAMGSLLLALAAIILYSNNQAWRQSGEISNRILDCLRTIYQSTSNDPETKIVGVPLVKDGVYICMNAIQAMTKKPFLDRDISNCKLLDNGDQLFPLGSLKDAITKGLVPIRFFYWDAISKTLKPVQLPAQAQGYAKSWRGEQLKSIVVSKRDPSSFTDWRSDGSLNVISMHRPVLEINLPGLPCWNTDFVALKVKLSHTDKAHFSPDCDLYYTNDLIDKYFFRDSTHARLLCTDEEQELIFPLRGLADWSMGGKCKQLKLVLPSHSDIEISEIFIPAAEKLLPRLSFSNSDSDSTNVTPVPTGTGAYDAPLQSQECLRVSKHPAQVINYDAHLIQDCDHVVLTILQPNTFFESLNSHENTTSKNILVATKAAGSIGSIKIDQNSFPEKGIYKARLDALDKYGEQVGIASDHFIIWVE